MKMAHGWNWPDHEEHMIDWMADPKNRMQLNGRWTYQGKKQAAFLKHCSRHRNVVDVGGHIALWAFNFAHVFEQVFAFEPVAAHRQCFEVNTKGLDNTTLYPYALGIERKLVSIKSTHGSSGDSTVSEGADVEMRLLDDFELMDVDALKIDCEGYEENVLRGAVNTIMANRPTIIVEQKRDMASRFGLMPQGAVEYLKNIGYQVVEVLNGDYIMCPRS